MLRTWGDMVAFCRQAWQAFWKALVAVHYFDFWRWAEEQAYPREFNSDRRYDRPFGGFEYEEPVSASLPGHPTGNVNDRYSR